MSTRVSEMISSRTFVETDDRNFSLSFGKNFARQCRKNWFKSPLCNFGRRRYKFNFPRSFKKTWAIDPKQSPVRMFKKRYFKSKNNYTSLEEFGKMQLHNELKLSLVFGKNTKKKPTKEKVWILMI